jgi:hypothetical protein
MYARKLLLRRFLRYEFGRKIYFINKSSYFYIIGIFINISHYCSPQLNNIFIPKFQQLRKYSLSTTVLTRSGNRSYTTRDMGHNSKGY